MDLKIYIIIIINIIHKTPHSNMINMIKIVSSRKIKVIKI